MIFRGISDAGVRLAGSVFDRKVLNGAVGARKWKSCCGRESLPRLLQRVASGSGRVACHLVGLVGDLEEEGLPAGADAAGIFGVVLHFGDAARLPA